MFCEEDWICHLDHVHIFATLLKRSVIAKFSLFLIVLLVLAEVLVARLLIQNFLIQFVVIAVVHELPVLCCFSNAIAPNFFLLLQMLAGNDVKC